jgi:hypothetical protein
MLHLSDRQKKKLELWRRSTPTAVNDATKNKFSLDLRQEAITDCSVVASMCVAFNMEERGFAKVSTTLSKSCLLLMICRYYQTEYIHKIPMEIQYQARTGNM